MEKVMNSNRIQDINTATETAKTISSKLAERQRLRHFSDITRMKREMIKSGVLIVEADFMKYWKDLQDAGAGSIVYGRRGKPDRFEWHYSLKDVANGLVKPKQVLAVKRRPGRPKGSKTRFKAKSRVGRPSKLSNKTELKKTLQRLSRELKIVSIALSKVA